PGGNRSIQPGAGGCDAPGRAALHLVHAAGRTLHAAHGCARLSDPPPDHRSRATGAHRAGGGARGSGTRMIRPVTVEDAAAGGALSSELGCPVSAEDVAGRVERLCGGDDQLVLAAVADDGTLVGWIHAADQDLVESERRCEILGLVVDWRRRRGGI